MSVVRSSCQSGRPSTESVTRPPQGSKFRTAVVCFSAQDTDMMLRPIIGAAALVCVAACSRGAERDATTTKAPLYDNLGSLHHAITTASPEAQRYFDQGLTLSYAFNHAEAIRAFRQAASIDPACAMCYWGVAFALGPNINAPITEDAAKEAYAAIVEAR